MKTTAASKPPRSVSGSAGSRIPSPGAGGAGPGAGPGRRPLPTQEPRTRPPRARPRRGGGQGHHHHHPGPSRHGAASCLGTYLAPQGKPCWGRAGPRHRRSRRLERLCQNPPAEEEAAAAAEGGRSCSRQMPPLPSAAFTRRPAAPVPQCRAAPSPALYARRGPRVEEPACRAPGPAGAAGCLLGGSIAARGGSAAGGAGVGGVGSRRKKGAKTGGLRRVQANSLLPGEEPAVRGSPHQTLAPPHPRGGRSPRLTPLRPALARGASVRGAVNGRPEGAGWGTRRDRTSLRRLALAGLVAPGRRQPFRALHLRGRGLGGSRRIRVGPFRGFKTEVALSHVFSPAWEGATSERAAPARLGPAPTHLSPPELASASAAFASAYFKTPPQKGR